MKPDSLDYHTTDGTPRWVIALQDYVRYSGDRSIVASLYPNVRASIEGALSGWTDASGYLVHADNETWMDARREGDLASYSPRSTRANDIQALWYGQLRAGAGFALATGDAASAQRWNAMADRVRANFSRDFVDPGTSRIADRLDARDQADRTLRPNLMFALDLVDDSALAARALRLAWESLVYPWGVATLDAREPFFHPYHLAPGHYHKDEAYHNGTVWLWLNGIAQGRMIDYGQPDLAWRLFEHANRLALQGGVVGGLPETMDAYPHPGESAPRLTGTFLQAWSNAEHQRVWYEHFLGVQPDLTRGVIRLAPRLPAAVADVEFNCASARGRCEARYVDRARPGTMSTSCSAKLRRCAWMSSRFHSRIPRSAGRPPGRPVGRRLVARTPAHGRRRDESGRGAAAKFGPPGRASPARCSVPGHRVRRTDVTRLAPGAARGTRATRVATAVRHAGQDVSYAACAALPSATPRLAARFSLAGRTHTSGRARSREARNGFDDAGACSRSRRCLFPAGSHAVRHCRFRPGPVLGLPTPCATG